MGQTVEIYSIEIDLDGSKLLTSFYIKIEEVVWVVTLQQSNYNFFSNTHKHKK